MKVVRVLRLVPAETKQPENWFFFNETKNEIKLGDSITNTKYKKSIHT